MPLRSDWSAQACPIARTLDVVGDPWVILILREALTGSTRFEQFRTRLEVADNVLSRRLAAMVEAGLLRRVAYRAEQRTHYEYQLTAAGADLLPVLNGLALWGEKHTPAPDGAHLQIVHVPCGAVTSSPDVCSNCGAVLAPDETIWRRDWLRQRQTQLVAGT